MQAGVKQITMSTRRAFLRSTMASLAGLSAAPLFACRHKNDATSADSRLHDLGPLLPPDENGLMLPEGFSSRIIASSGLAPYSGSSYLWHDAPDGGATFTSSDNGWIYVSNSEISSNRGGASALKFDAFGNIIQAYSILDNTTRNCAGGATPWGTWLSCEEYDQGIVWECDPQGQLMPVKRPALGTFAHEAVTVDTLNHHLYMTEDKKDGGFYRFVPDSLNSKGHPDLSAGKLQVAVVDFSKATVNWLDVPEPAAITQATRYQLSSSTGFKGGEGIVFYKGVVSFATKGDNRIWSYDTASNKISVLYDADTHPDPILTGVDNIALSHQGELIVGEDGGNMQLVAITKTNNLVPLVQLVGHDFSEVTGPAFSPDGKRLYFSSQRGTTGISGDGMTFEVLGPFHQ